MKSIAEQKTTIRIGYSDKYLSSLGKDGLVEYQRTHNLNPSWVYNYGSV